MNIRSNASSAMKMPTLVILISKLKCVYLWISILNERWTNVEQLIKLMLETCWNFNGLIDSTQTYSFVFVESKVFNLKKQMFCSRVKSSVVLISWVKSVKADEVSAKTSLITFGYRKLGKQVTKMPSKHIKQLNLHLLSTAYMLIPSSFKRP